MKCLTFLFMTLHLQSLLTLGNRKHVSVKNSYSWDIATVNISNIQRRTAHLIGNAIIGYQFN